MSDLENDSRTSAVGRKRNRPGKHYLPSSAANKAGEGAGSSSKRSSSKETNSRRSSLESGEISSAVESHDKWGPDFIRIKFQIPKKRRLTESTSGSVFDEDRGPSEVVPVMKSMMKSIQAESAFSEPHAITRSTVLEGTRLCDLTFQEVVEQELYFDLNLEKYPDDLCYCMYCGGRGHMASVCSEVTCKHCGAKEEHASYACPIFRKCRLCRQRGHDAIECTNPAKDSDHDSCDICGEAGHVEEQCARLWSTSQHPDPTDKVRKIHDHRMIIACYSCGSGYHWGDDCPHRDRYAPRSLTKTWSKTFADQFIIERESRTEWPSDSSAEKEPQVKPQRNW